MGDLLFLAHRMPALDGCADAARGYHVLRHLASRHRIHLVAYTDDARDAGRKAGLAGLTASREVLWRSNPRPALPGAECLPAHYKDERIRALVAKMLRERRIDTIHAMGSQMVQHVPAATRARLVVDFIRPASERLHDIAASLSAPARIVARHRARALRKHERSVVERADASLFAERRFARLFEGDQAEGRLFVVENGIDPAFFSPDAAFRRIEPSGPLIFVAGCVRNRADARALAWLADAVLPHVRLAFPQARLVVARGDRGDRGGRGAALPDRPRDIVVIDAADRRPWLAVASAVVAPGTTDDAAYAALEGMTMGRPVIASAAVAQTLDHGDSLRVADGVTETADAILWALENHRQAAEQGAAARLRMVERYPWEACLAPLMRALRTPPR